MGSEATHVDRGQSGIVNIIGNEEWIQMGMLKWTMGSLMGPDMAEDEEDCKPIFLNNFDEQ